MEIGRPAQSKQPSRKGKKAWRKNINIDEISEGMDTIREIERDTGVKDMGVLASSELFQVDEAGDDQLLSKKQRAVKPMKADEILGRRSKVPALESKKTSERKRLEGLTSRQVKKLLDRAGKSTSRVSTRVEHQGLGKPASYDLWGEEPAEVVPGKGSFINDLKSANSHNPSTTAPMTIGKNPMSLAADRKKVDAVVLPEEGKSYNPTVESWQALFEAEHAKEAQREEERLRLEEERNRIQLIIANYDDHGELSDSSDEEEEPAEEQEEEDANEKTSLSVNKPVQNKKKLRKQRNKEQRHQQRTKLEADLKDLKKQIRDLENIPKLLQEAERQIAAHAAAVAKGTASMAQGGSENLKRKAPRMSRNHKLADTPLELKLSDELTDSLRLLRPEGNLSADRFRSLQERGLIEPRVPVQKKRKYAPKVTEKWGFKDITL